MFNKLTIIIINLCTINLQLFLNFSSSLDGQTRRPRTHKDLLSGAAERRRDSK